MVKATIANCRFDSNRVETKDVFSGYGGAINALANFSHSSKTNWRIMNLLIESSI